MIVNSSTLINVLQGLGFLDMADCRVDQRDTEDDATVDSFAKCEGDNHCTQRDVDERLMELTQKNNQWAFALFQRQSIRPEPFLPVSDLEHVQALGFVRLKQCRDLVVR
jgi:hypothetical protein